MDAASVLRAKRRVSRAGAKRSFSWFGTVLAEQEWLETLVNNIYGLVAVILRRVIIF